MNHSYLNNCFDEPRLVKSTGDESQIAHKFIRREKKLMENRTIERSDHQ